MIIVLTDQQCNPVITLLTATLQNDTNDSKYFLKDASFTIEKMVKKKISEGGNI